MYVGFHGSCAKWPTAGPGYGYCIPVGMMQRPSSRTRNTGVGFSTPTGSEAAITSVLQSVSTSLNLATATRLTI